MTPLLDKPWMLLGLRGGFATHWRGTWYLSSVEFTHSVMSDSLRLYELQQARPPCASPTPGVHPNSCALNRWCHPAISSSVIPFSSCFQFFPASGSFPMSWLCVRWPISLELQHQSFQCIFRVDFLYDWLVWSPCSPRDSQESSPAPQFKNINSSVLSFLYSPTLTSIHDYWKNHSLE